MNDTERTVRRPDAAAMFAQALVAFAVYEGAVMVAALAVGVGAIDAAQPASIERAAFGMALGLPMTVVFAVLWRPAAAWWRAGVVAPTVVLYGLFLAAWFPFTMIAYPHVVEAFGGRLQPQPFLEYYTGAPASVPGLAAVVLASCLLAPVAEEIVFRGYLQQALKAVMPAWLAVVATATVFGLFHGVVYALPVGLLGLLFGALEVRFGCLAAPILAHALHNTLTVASNAAFPELLEWVYRR